MLTTQALSWSNYLARPAEPVSEILSKKNFRLERDIFFMPNVWLYHKYQ